MTELSSADLTSDVSPTRRAPWTTWPCISRCNSKIVYNAFVIGDDFREMTWQNYDDGHRFLISEFSVRARLQCSANGGQTMSRSCAGRAGTLATPSQLRELLDDPSMQQVVINSLSRARGTGSGECSNCTSNCTSKAPIRCGPVRHLIDRVAHVGFCESIWNAIQWHCRKQHGAKSPGNFCT